MITKELDSSRIECQQAVENAKLSYLLNLGNKVNNVTTSQNTYWRIVNRVMNKCRAPKIPPLLVNSLFILISRLKAKYFNDFFSKQCRPIINTSGVGDINPGDIYPGDNHSGPITPGDINHVRQLPLHNNYPG